MGRGAEGQSGKGTKAQRSSGADLMRKGRFQFLDTSFRAVSSHHSYPAAWFLSLFFSCFSAICKMSEP
jgi:hypothetical protein